MSTVEITSFNLGGSSGKGKNSTAFSDNFTRANAGSWGSNWSQIAISCGAAVGDVRNTIVSNSGVITQGGSGSPQTVFVPVPFLWMEAQAAALSHFSQFKYVSQSSAAFDIYCACVCSVDGFNNLVGFYGIQISTALAITLQKVTYPGSLTAGAGFTQLSNLGGTSIAAGDTVRLEARISGSTWTLNALQNGTSVGTATDTSFGIGAPGVSAILTGNGQTVTIGSYSGGLL